MLLWKYVKCKSNWDSTWSWHTVKDRYKGKNRKKLREMVTVWVCGATSLNLTYVSVHRSQKDCHSPESFINTFLLTFIRLHKICFYKFNLFSRNPLFKGRYPEYFLVPVLWILFTRFQFILTVTQEESLSPHFILFHSFSCCIDIRNSFLDSLMQI